MANVCHAYPIADIVLPMIYLFVWIVGLGCILVELSVSLVGLIVSHVINMGVRLV